MAYINTRKLYWSLSTITNIFLDQKWINVCEHTVKMMPRGRENNHRKMKRSPEERHTRKLNWNILMITDVFFNQKRVNVCWHTVHVHIHLCIDGVVIAGQCTAITYIYSLLIEKDILQLSFCVFLCAFPVEISSFFGKFSFSFLIFLCYKYFSTFHSFWCIILTYCMFFSDMVLPPNANVYYAVNTQFNLNFILRPKRHTPPDSTAAANKAKPVKKSPVATWRISCLYYRNKCNNKAFMH